MPREQNRSSSRPQPTAKTQCGRIGRSGSTWRYPRAGWVPQKRQGMMVIATYTTVQKSIAGNTGNILGAATVSGQ